jgi:hypothetical protein
VAGFLLAEMIYGSVSNKKVSKADLIDAKDACGVSLLASIDFHLL